jgi:hypothetical protein
LRRKNRSKSAIFGKYGVYDYHPSRNGNAGALRCQTALGTEIQTTSGAKEQPLLVPKEIVLLVPKEIVLLVPKEIVLLVPKDFWY